MVRPTGRRFSTPLLVASALVLIAALALGGSGWDQGLASAAPSTPTMAGKVANPTGTPTAANQAAAKPTSPAATGKIAIFKFMCTTIGQNHTCNGRDTDLIGYYVNFQVFAGASASGPVLETIPVTLGLNDQEKGRTGDGSQGRNTGGLNYNAVSPNNVYTVCEVPVAIKGSSRVDLTPQARPPAGGGGSTGGTNQTLLNNACIVLTLMPGTAELQYLDTKAPVVPTATATPTGTSVSTPTNTPTATATNTPGGPVFTPTATATATNTPIIGGNTPTATATNTPVVGGNTPTATATATNTPGVAVNTPTATPTSPPSAASTPTSTAVPTNTPSSGGGATATPTPGTSGGATSTPAPTTAGVTTATPPAVVLAETPAAPPAVAQATPSPQVLAATPTPPVTVLPATGAGGLPLTELPLGLMLADALGLLGGVLVAASRWRTR